MKFLICAIVLCILGPTCFGESVNKGNDLAFKLLPENLVQGEIWLGSDLVTPDAYEHNVRYGAYRAQGLVTQDATSHIFMAKAAFYVERDSSLVRDPNLFSLSNLKQIFPDMVFTPEAGGAFRAAVPVPGIVRAFVDQKYLECDA